MSTLFRVKDYGYSIEGALQDALRLYEAEVSAGNRARVTPKLNKWGEPWAYRVDVVERVQLSILIGRQS